jgi:succinate dehydrogenase hydrophobic anchor subunit
LEDNLISEGITNNRLENLFISKMERIPILSTYARTRGWPYILAWGHRVAGLLVVAFVWFHILTLSSLLSPSFFDAKMKIFGFFIFGILEWALAIPVIFHALNGARLILYESFGIRNDESMIRWVFWLSFIYVAFLGMWMLAGNQSASAVFFLVSTLVAGLVLGYGVASKIWKSKHSVFWKLQRITGAFLLVMIPAHLLFMHLNPSLGHSSEIVIMRMQNVLIRVIDLALVVAVLYHGAYGVLSVIGDYFGSRLIRIGFTAAVVLVMAVFAFIGIRLIILI